MAQGNLKTKVSLPAGAKQKQKHVKKHLGPKKGARHIAPKKTKHIEAAKLKKAVGKQINSKIEHNIMMKASSVEAKSFSVVQPSGSAEMSKKTPS